MRLVGLTFTLVALALLAGCLEPYRVHVDEAALLRASVPWKEERLGLESGGVLGPKTYEVQYRFDPSGQGPPFPGIVQVFSIRQVQRDTTDDLAARALSVVEAALEQHGVTVDRSKDDAGTRVIANGITTQWFVREGTVRSSGGFFSEDVKVRVVGEVGFDGRANTAFLSVGMAQIERSVRVGQCGPIIPDCQNDIERQRDETTWRSVAGDPAGTMAPKTENGLLWNLVTHG